MICSVVHTTDLFLFHLLIHRINTITIVIRNSKRTKSTHTVTMMAVDEDDIGGGGDVDDVGDGRYVDDIGDGNDVDDVGDGNDVDDVGDDGGEVDGDIGISGVHRGTMSSDRST